MRKVSDRIRKALLVFLDLRVFLPSPLWRWPVRFVEAWRAVAAVALVLALAAAAVAAAGEEARRPRSTVGGVLQPGDRLVMHVIPGHVRGAVEYVVLENGALGCRSDVPDIPARDWYAFGESNGWTRSATRQLGPDRAKAVGVAIWKLARCYTPPSADRSCQDMPDWTGKEIRTWSAELLRRHPGLGWIGSPILDGLTDAEVEDLYDRARAFARGCPGLADEK